MGTNTFHLVLAERTGDRATIIHRDSRFVFLGKGGIDKGIITSEAIDRALDCLRDYAAEIKAHAPSQVHVYATSALRSAANRQEVVQQIYDHTGLQVAVIDGLLEAQLITRGVFATTPVPADPVCIMDIGGGSVEFTISDKHTIYWEHSFEMGGQRLLSAYMSTDPIAATDIERLRRAIQSQFSALWQAIETYHPATLVGASGTFRSLQDMQKAATGAELPIMEKAVFAQWLTRLNKLSDTERQLIPGLKPERSQMIVVVLHLLAVVLEHIHDDKFYIAAGALKEGAVANALQVTRVGYPDALTDD